MPLLLQKGDLPSDHEEKRGGREKQKKKTEKKQAALKAKRDSFLFLSILLLTVPDQILTQSPMALKGQKKERGRPTTKREGKKRRKQQQQQSAFASGFNLLFYSDSRLPKNKNGMEMRRFGFNTRANLI